MLIYISLSLFLIGRIGFRAISRVLGVLAPYFGIDGKVPCPQTIINWLTRYSLSKIWTYSGLPSVSFEKNKFVNGAIWIIDTSIALGVGKILAVLELNINHHATNESAPALKNINCVAISVASSWTGKSIADFLQQVIHITGKPAAYLKDGGLDLKKGVRLLKERGLYSHSIDDVSHVVANLLKKEYNRHPSYDGFISACGQASKKMKQTDLGCLVPPKVSTKARFMNIHRLVKWAEMILQHSPRGRTSEGSVIAKLRNSIGKLSEHRPFIKRFLRDARPLLESQKILKHRGLNFETYKECKAMLQSIPQRSQVSIGFMTWMENQLIVASSLGLNNIGMPICSDNIESLFGLGKTHGVGEVKDANRIALRLPAFCGTLPEDAAKMVMRVTVKEQQEIEKKLLSLTRQRREILPNPGSMTAVFSSEKRCYLSLLPVPKNGEKTENIIDITASCGKFIGHMKSIPDNTNNSDVTSQIRSVIA
ncbi:hypothetical protein [Desulfobacula toluolica]|uniref:hypothetical protein n=1 Tax=Desulfobacula toluolica TaxID=28223 RepID=UPI0002FD39A4|nr:hypothetical protein [Desulfobacula toluolica]